MGVVAYTDVKKNKTCESETDLTDLNTSPVMHDRSYRLTSSATPYPQHVACLMSLRGCVCVCACACACVLSLACAGYFPHLLHIPPHPKIVLIAFIQGLNIFPMF